MTRIIEVVVSPTGEATIQTKGYQGSDCLQASKFLEQSLGVASNNRHTAEFYQSTTTQQTAMANRRPRQAGVSDATRPTTDLSLPGLFTTGRALSSQDSARPWCFLPSNATKGATS